ncbi:Protein of unknown function DUF3568 [Desulfovibrio sp. X2]|uniref:DUF3568 family protein n=1 Tax=Desulfovibrio sp. X2 TaxID=941449 RepID=UPI0003589E78|nr:DUF3568 family protein [Desulfovibrio sp. X2]EPR37510.1 Protein of unknown function DUF3568 [Desulfovibrio sp. X2]
MKRFPRTRTLPTLLSAACVALCLVLALAASGCGLVAAGAVGGTGAMAYRGYTARDYTGSVERVQQAVRQAIASMHLHVLDEKKVSEEDGGSHLSIYSEFDDGTDFRVSLRPKKGGVTLVEVWVGHIGDPARSNKVLDAVDTAMGQKGTPV